MIEFKIKYDETTGHVDTEFLNTQNSDISMIHMAIMTFIGQSVKQMNDIDRMITLMAVSKDLTKLSKDKEAYKVYSQYYSESRSEAKEILSGANKESEKDVSKKTIMEILNLIIGDNQDG